MLSALTTPFQRYWLIGLLVLWAVLLFGGFFFGKLDARRERRMPTWTRIGSSLTLVVAAWSWFTFSQATGANTFALLIAIGMTLGFIGDLFMARLIPVSQHVLGGIGAFGLGHAAYIAAALTFGTQHGLNAPGPRFGAWVAWLLIGLAGWYFVVFRGQKPTTLRWIALLYSLLLASTAGFATGLALQSADFIPFAVGAALFLLSETVLAANLFRRRHFTLIHDVVWLTYGPGQMLIVYSVSGALRAVGQ